MPSQRCTQTTNSCGDMVRPKTELGVTLIHEPAKGAEIYIYIFYFIYIYIF